MGWIGSFGITEVLIILFIVVLVLGGRRLPQLGEGLREGIEKFLASMNGDPGGVSCKACREPIGPEFRCRRCGRITPAWEFLVISFAVSVVIFGALFLSEM